MKKRSFLGYFAGCASALITAGALGCGGGGSICDVSFESIAGGYSFTWTTHNVRYENSCFDTFSSDQIDPADMTDCAWSEKVNEDTFTIELVIEDDGDIGSARIIDVKGEDAEVEKLGVKCEMLEGELCDAPIRCTITGDSCDVEPFGEPDGWMYACNCSTGSANDPTSAACQQCKSEYDTYSSELNEYCEKGREGDYVEFTLHVKEE